MSNLRASLLSTGAVAFFAYRPATTSSRRRYTIRGAVFAAKAGRRPPPPAHPVTVTTSIAATPKPSTSRPPLPRNKPDLAAITRAAGRNQEVSTEAQAKIAEAISRVAKVAAKAANKSEADAGLRDLQTALQGVD